MRVKAIINRLPASHFLFILFNQNIQLQELKLITSIIYLHLWNLDLGSQTLSLEGDGITFALSKFYEIPLCFFSQLIIQLTSKGKSTKLKKGNWLNRGIQNSTQHGGDSCITEWNLTSFLEIKWASFYYSI